jgi:hypothetical protein
MKFKRMRCSLYSPRTNAIGWMEFLSSPFLHMSIEHSTAPHSQHPTMTLFRRERESVRSCPLQCPQKRLPFPALRRQAHNIEAPSQHGLQRSRGDFLQSLHTMNGQKIPRSVHSFQCSLRLLRQAFTTEFAQEIQQKFSTSLSTL